MMDVVSIKCGCKRSDELQNDGGKSIFTKEAFLIGETLLTIQKLLQKNVNR